MMASTFEIYFVLLICAVTCSANIQEKLSYFETLKVTDFFHRSKRSADPDPHSSSHITEVQVTTLGRHFHLYLKPSQILSSGFRASVEKGNGHTETFTVNRASMLTGEVAGDASAVANVNYEDNGSILANIVTKHETYVIEPSWRLLPESDNHTMVAYKKSDMRLQDADRGNHLHSTCGIKEDYNDPELHGQVDVQTNNETHRAKRQSPYLAERLTCEMMVVADYKFFEHMGGKSASATALYLINVIQFVNTIYRNTQFGSGGNGMKGLGFEIGEIKIHNESTDSGKTLQGRSHYNVRTGFWDTKDLLEAFSMDKYFKGFCLAHLFTYRQFSDGVLGLAYIASERKSAVGGICSPYYPKYPGTKMTLNTGWSSSQNAAGHRILALQAQLVTAHELGHNMGSEHDPETDSCAPSEYKNGKYIMYPWAVSGYDDNNQLFSPCSREYIFKVAKVKGYNCFKEAKEDAAFCGNGRIDKDEECDSGWSTKNGADFCCDENCQLRRGKKCSPMNYGCCTQDCQPAQSGVVCRPAIEGSCLDEIKCDGAHISCPNITKNKKDNQACIDEGICQNGECLNICQMHDPSLTPCICAKDTDHACHRCCKPANERGLCASINRTRLPDGRPCYQGLCNKGVCEKKRRDMVQRLFNIIEDITVDQLVEFMRSNIVGTVIVLSLFIWIPASCLISYIDKKTSKKERAKRNWMSRSNRTLFSEEESNKIRRVANVRVPRNMAGSVVRRDGEPTVRWPDSEPSNRPLPRPAQPMKWPLSGATGTGAREEGMDIGPDHETVV